MKRKIAAILAADVAGYSRLVAEAEEETLARLAAYREVFDDFVKRYGGRIFNTAGDSVMCEFDSAVEAVRAAIDIQEALRTRNLDLPPNRRLQFRIGITIGDVVERGGDLLGDGVNIAARLENLAEPGGICISRSVHEAVANKISVPFRDIGQREVKNIPHPVHAFVVAWPTDERRLRDGGGRWAGAVSERNGSRRRLALGLGAGAAAALLAVMGGAYVALREAAPRGAVEQPGRLGDISAEPSEAELAGRPAERPPNPAEAAAFAALSRQDGLVPDPKTAPELYHNARLLEARGDPVQARRTYHALAMLGGEHLDPHLRYAALLRVQDGRAGAREVYSELMREKPTRVAALVHALQFEGAERREKVAAFASLHPDVAPAHYLLAEEHGEDRIGGAQTLHDRRIEFEALSAFLTAEKDGRLASYFLDQSVLAAWLDKARRRHAALQSFFQNTPIEPAATFIRSNAAWMVSLTLPEAATTISYRVGEEGEFKPTGHLHTIDPRTGKAAPNPGFELPPEQRRTTLYVRYADAAGRGVGPFALSFDPRQALVAQQKDVLERMPGAWIAFGREGSQLVYFTHLVGYRCAIAKAFLGLDGGPLNIELPLPPCDERDPYAVPPQATPYLTVPRSTESVSVQLTYADGAQSDVHTFRR